MLVLAALLVVVIAGLFRKSPEEGPGISASASVSTGAASVAPPASAKPVGSAEDECSDVRDVEDLEEVMGRWQLFNPDGAIYFSSRDSTDQLNPYNHQELWPWQPFPWHLKAFEGDRGVECNFYPLVHHSKHGDDSWRVGYCWHLTLEGDKIVSETSTAPERVFLTVACASLCMRVGKFQTCTMMGARPN